MTTPLTVEWLDKQCEYRIIRLSDCFSVEWQVFVPEPGADIVYRPQLVVRVQGLVLNFQLRDCTTQEDVQAMMEMLRKKGL